LGEDRLTKMENPECGQMIRFLLQHFGNGDVQEVAQRGHIKEMFTHFVFDDIQAMITQLAGKMSLEVAFPVGCGQVFRKSLPASVDFDTTAFGNGFHQSANHARIRFLQFGCHIQKATVSKQKVSHLLLKRMKVVFTHRLHLAWGLVKLKSGFTNFII
jgi:hypothetical protein